MMKQRDKLFLSFFAALFIVLALGGQLHVPILNWWCAAFPGQSPVEVAAGENVIYSLRLAELLSKLIR